MRFDVTGELEKTYNTPETAVKNLQGAAIAQEDPDQFAQRSKIEQQKVTANNEATRSVASAMTESAEKAAAISPDISRLNWGEKFGRRTSLGMQSSDIGRKRAAAANAVSDMRARGQEPSEEQLMELDMLREDADTVDKQISDLDVGIGTSGLAQIFISGSDTLKDIWAQKEIVAGSAATGAAIGAAGGSVAIPFVGTFAGAGGGALTGLATGTFAAGFAENYKRFRGESYDELSILQKDGKAMNLPETTKNNIATGVAMFGATSEFLGEKLLANRIPVLKRILSTKRIRQYATDPIVKANVDAIGKFAKEVIESGIIEGTTEVAQNLSDLLGKELGRTWNGKETSFADALSVIGNKMTSGKQAVDPGTGQPIVDKKGQPVTQRGEFWKEQAETFGVAFIAGSGFTTIGHGYSKVHDKVFTKNKTSLQQEIGVENAPVVPDTAPSAESGSIPVEQTVGPGQEAMVVNDGIPTNLKPQMALNFALTMGAISNITEDTKINGSPADAVKIQAKMLQESGIKTAWVSPEALNKWANTEAKVEKVQSWLIGKKREDAALGGRVAVDPETLLDMIRTDDTLINDVRETPDSLSYAEAKIRFEGERQRAQEVLTAQGLGEATPAPVVDSTSPASPLSPAPADTRLLGPSASDEEFRNILGNRQEANAYLSRLSDELQTPSIAPERAVAIQQTIDKVNAIAESLPEQEQTPAIRDGELSQEEEIDAVYAQYMSEPIHTDLIRAGIPKAVVSKLDQEYRRIRTDIVAATKEAADLEMNRVVDLVTEISKVEDAIEARDQSLSDPNIDIVENFLANRDTMRVDPSTLTEAQTRRYADDPVIKYRKVLKKDGISLDELAQRLGVRDTDAALEILATVPDRKQALKNAETLAAREIDVNIAEGVGINEAAIVKAITDKQRMAMQEFKELVNSSWVTARNGIEKTILSRINLDAIREESKTKIQQTRLSELNPKNYEVASKLARKRAIKAALRGDFLEASRQREIEIKADEMYKQALIATGRANRMTKRIAKRLRNPEVIQTVKEAGNLEAFQEFNHIVNLDPNGPESKRGSYDKWVKQQIKDQITDPSIPVELAETFDPRATIQDLSFEQLSYIYNKQSEIIKSSQAQVEFNAGQEKLYDTQVEELVEQTLTSHPDYNLKNLEIGHETLSSNLERAANLFSAGLSKLNNVNYTMLKLTKGDRTSPLYQMVYGALKGVGAFDNGYGEKATGEWRAKIRERFLEKAKAYDIKRIEKYGTTLITPLEFKGSVGLLDSNGNMTKLDLLTMLAYYGSETGRQRLSNFQITPDSILEVAERELTLDDVKFLQEAVHDTYDLLRDPITRAVQELRNEDVDFIDGAGYEIFGEKFRGGYLPLRYRENLTIEQAAKASAQETNVAIGEDEASHIDESALNGFTRQGNLIQRVKNYDGILSLNFNSAVTAGFEDTITTMTMAVPIQQSMRILNNPENAKHIQATIGKDRLKMLKANILSTGKSIFSERVAIVQDMEESIVGRAKWFGKNFVKNTLIFVPSTAFVQLTSLSFLFSDLGVRGSAQYGWTAAKMLMQPWNIPTYLRFAKELDPSIGEYFDNVEAGNRGGIGDVTPRNRSQSRFIRFAESLDHAVSTAALKYLLGSVDVAMKVPAAINYYNRFADGKIKGHPMSSLEGKSMAEITNLARNELVGRSSGILTASTTLEKAYAQKSRFLSDWTAYFNDARNIFNYAEHRVFDKTRWAIKESRKAYQEGNYGKMVSNSMGAAGNLISFQFAAAAAGVLMQASRGLEDEEGFELTAFTSKWEDEILSRLAVAFFKPWTIAGLMVDAQPIIRDIEFNLEMRDETNGRFVSIIAPPYIRALNDGAAGLAALKNLLIYQELTNKEEKELVKGLGTVIPGFPYRAVEKFNKWNESDDAGFIDNVAKDPGRLLLLPFLAAEAVRVGLAGGKFQMVNQARAYKQEFDPTSSFEQNNIANGSQRPITEYEARIIRYAESAGDDSAQAGSSSAAGRYQYTEGTWNDLMRNFPELGLTRSGRTRSVEQQEMAFSKSTELYAKAFLRAGVEVSVETIYMAHHFGESVAIAIMQADDSRKLSNVKIGKRRAVSDAAIEANKWLDTGVRWINGGKPAKTVGQFKRALSDILARGEERSDAALDKGLD